MRTWRTTCVIAALLALAAPASAQLTTGAPVELAPDQRVWITTSDGTAREGRVVSLSNASIEVRSRDGIASFPWIDVQKVETPDPIRDGIRRGTIAGAVAGGGWGMLLGYGLRCRSNCGEDYSVARDIAGGALIGGVVGTGWGIAYGAVIDWLVHRRRTMYQSERPLPGARLTPTFSEHGARVALTVVWP